MPIDESKAGTLMTDMETALKGRDWRAHLKAEEELENLYLAEAAEQGGIGNFEVAAASQKAVADLNHALETVLVDFLATNPKDKEELEQALDGARGFATLYRALSEAVYGVSYIQSRRLGEAKDSFDRAESMFGAMAKQEGAGMIYPDLWQANSDYCRAEGYVVTGIEEMTRSNYGSAIAAFQIAAVGMESVVDRTSITQSDEESALMDELLAGVRRELDSTRRMFLLSSYNESIFDGDYEAAVKHSTDLCKLCKLSVDEAPDDPPFYRPTMECELNTRLAELENAKAQLAKDQGRWDEALANYGNCRSRYREAAASMLRTGLPGATAGQDALLNQATITAIWIRECKKAQSQAEDADRVKEELQQLRTAVSEKLGNPKIEVHTSAQASASAEATLEATVQIVNQTEKSIRGVSHDLLGALDKTDLDSVDKNAIRQLAQALVDDPEKGVTYIEKAKDGTGKIADIVKNIGAVASPLVPLIRPLAALVGLPMPV